MKKFLILIGAILFTSTASFGIDCDSLQCPENPYSGSLSFSNVTGVNPLAEQIANAIIKKEIKKESKGKYSVKLQSYNINALKQGKFKSLEILGQDVVTEDIYVSSLRFKTLCDYNYIEVNNKENTITFKENFGMSYIMKFSEKDLNRTMEGSKYNELIRKVNSIGNSYKLFNIVSNSVKINDNRLFYIIKVAIPLLNTKKDIIVETDFKVRNGELILNNTKLVTENLKFDISKLERLINYLNPLDFSMQIVKNHDSDMAIKEVTIKDNMVNIGGLVTIYKGAVTEK